MAVFIYCIILAAVFLVKASEYQHCSGHDISSFPDINLQEYAGEYNVFYVSDTSNISTGPIDAVLTLVTPKSKGFNKFLILGTGTNRNGDVRCVNGLAQAYLLRDNRPCFHVRILNPLVRCGDMEWIYSKISEDKLMFYHCAKFKADGSCAAKVIRGLSTQKSLTLVDKQAFRDAFARFGEPLPKMVDPLNNACQKIKRETEKFIEADRRLKDNGYY